MDCISLSRGNNTRFCPKQHTLILKPEQKKHTLTLRLESIHWPWNQSPTFKKGQWNKHTLPLKPKQQKHTLPLTNSAKQTNQSVSIKATNSWAGKPADHWAWNHPVFVQLGADFPSLQGQPPPGFFPLSESLEWGLVRPSLPKKNREAMTLTRDERRRGEQNWKSFS